MGIVTVRLHGAAAGGRKEGAFCCGNWGLTGRIVGWGRLAIGCGGIQGDVDVLENVAWGDGDHAVGLDEVVAGFAVLLTAQSVDETERRAERASADSEAGAVGLPVVEFAADVVAGWGNFLFVLGHSRFTGRAQAALIFLLV